MMSKVDWRWLGAIGAALLIVAFWVRPAAPHGDTLNLNWTFKDLDGHDVHLADYKGKPLLINLWATWCEPCKLEIPELVELQAQYKSRDFTIVGISVDDSAEDIKKFAAEYKINYPLLVGRDRDDALEALGYQLGVPVSMFVRKDGTLSIKKEGIATKTWFDQQIRALF